jgi:hypothetical protein
MNEQQRKQLIIHLGMILAAQKMMLRNLDGLLTDDEINEALDTINKIQQEIVKLENQR